MADVELEDDPTVGGVTLRWLRQLVMSVVSQYPEPDLWDVARKVHAEIPPDLQYQATVILLRAFVQQTIGYDRYRPGSVPREKPDLPAKPRLAPLKGSTPRTQRGRDAWKARLEHYVSPVLGQSPKRLGETTLDDHLALKAQYAQRKQTNERFEVWHGLVIEAMRAAKAGKLCALPQKTLKPLLEQYP
jgi:hypothetical protein